jgi:hypothetical protein
MIYITFNPTIDKEHVYFKLIGNNFDVEVDFFRNRGVKFDGDTKSYIMKPNVVLDYDVIAELEDITNIDVNRKTISEIKEYAYITGIKKRRFIIDTSFMKGTPLIGKSPFENYQMDDLQKGLNRNRFYYGWDMGLGKSWVMTQKINQLWGAGLIDSVLILTKPEGTINTKVKLINEGSNSFSNFFTEDDIYVVHTKNRHPFESGKKVIICPYHMFRIICEDEYFKKKKKRPTKGMRTPIYDLNKMGWGTQGKRFIALDESDEMGNPKSKQTKTVLAHIDFFEYRYLYSGTPADNSPLKWYSQLKIMDKNLINLDYTEWQRTIGKVGDRYSKFRFVKVIPEKYEKFKENILMKNVSFRSKKDVLDLPNNYIKKVYCELSEKQKDIYQNIVSSVLTKMKENNNGQLVPKKVESKFPFISKALDNPDMLKDDFRIDRNSLELHKLLDNWKFTDHSKLDILNSLVKDHMEKGKKLIVWSFHPDTINSLVDHFKEYDPMYIHGQVKIPKGMSNEEYKFKITTDFQNSEGSTLGIFSLKSLKTSVDLNTADAMIFFDRSYDITEFSQPMARVERWGLKKDIITYVLILRDTLDERIDKNIETKHTMKSELYEKQALTEKEWIKVFKGELLC